MKVYLIKSKTSAVPLAEVRTDGTQVEFIVDNTGGELPTTVGKSLAKLQQMVEHSSHLEMTEPEVATSHLLRYVLNNGDVVEITTDGTTVMVNGTLLDEQQKVALFNAIKIGKLSVTRRADISNPVPVMPSPQMAPPKMTKLPTIHMNRDLIHATAKHRELEHAMAKRGKVFNDLQIENANYSGDEAPDFTKKIWYALKYGGGTSNV